MGFIKFSVGLSLPVKAEKDIFSGVRELVEGRISRSARGKILSRTNRGSFLSQPGGGSIIPAAPYSTRRISIPQTRTAREDPSSTRRSRYARMVSKLFRGPKIVKGGRAGRRRWHVNKEGSGYLGLRRALGLKTKPDMKFTGKMLEDFRVRVRFRTNPKEQRFSYRDLVTRGFAEVFATGRRRNKDGMLKPGRKGDSIELLDMQVEFGFSTQASHRIGMFHHRGLGGKRRIFAGLSTGEARQVQGEAVSLVSAVLTGQPVKGEGKSGKFYHPRDKGGRFIRLAY